MVLCPKGAQFYLGEPLIATFNVLLILCKKGHMYRNDIKQLYLKLEQAKRGG